MGSYGVKYDSKISDIIYVCSLRKGRGLSKNQGRHLWTGLLSLCSYHRCCRRTLDFSRFCHSWHTLGSLHKLTPREIEANGRKVAVNGHHVEVSISCKYCRNKATITFTYLLTGTLAEFYVQSLQCARYSYIGFVMQESLLSMVSLSTIPWICRKLTPLHDGHSLPPSKHLLQFLVEANSWKVAVNGHHVQVSISCKYFKGQTKS